MKMDAVTIEDIAEWLEENYPGSDIAADARLLASGPGDIVEAQARTYSIIDVPVIDGIATLPDGRTVESKSAIVRVPVLTALAE